MLIGRSSCRLLAVGRPLHESFVVFDFFFAIFISWIVKNIRHTPHRRLEIKEVSEQSGSDPPDQLATHILKTDTTGENLRVT